MPINTNNSDLLNLIDKNNLPKHIAIIMDGNGRWAEKFGRTRLFGHKNGMKAVKKTVEACRKLGIKVLTLYAFSTENWNRPLPEVSGLMKILKEYVKKEVQNLNKQNISIRCIGDINKLYPEPREALLDAIELTKNNNAMILNLALSYSGRYEITEAIKNISRDILNNKILIENIDENLISNYLFTSGQPDPDLLIRTSYELRISNFLLWQIAYTELYFTETLWPDFNENDLYKAIIDYQKRDRRFGRVKI